MIRKLLISLIILIGLTTLVNAECNFRIADFGGSKESVKFSEDEPSPLIIPDQFGGENIIIPLESLCQEQKELFGTSVIFLFIENKLERIQLFRANMQDRNLMEFSRKRYGDFELPGNTSKFKWRGNHFWENKNLSIEYIMTDIHDGHAEILDITNLKNVESINNYNEKVGKWLDSQN